MKNNNKKIINIILITLALIVGIDVITNGNLHNFIASVNPMNLKSSDVPYTNNSQSTIQGALDVLYTKASSIPEVPVKLGDYVSLTPPQTSYTIKSSLTGNSSDQIINPSELTLWRVIDIHSDGSFDAVSEYTSSTDVNFNGITGYANLVGGLNTIAAQYQVPGYTIGSRHIGYGGQSSIIGDTSSFDGSSTTAPSSSSTSALNIREYNNGVEGDTLYSIDNKLVGNVYKSDTATYGNLGLKAYDVSSTTTVSEYWLASRYYHCTEDTAFAFHRRYVNTSGAVSSNSLRGYNNIWGNAKRKSRIRPILTLRSGLTVSGGSGTKLGPYTLQ